MKHYLVTAADSLYVYQALNLVGSAQASGMKFAKIRIYDLGMSRRQRRLFDGIAGVELKTVPDFTPYAHQCYSWKPWVMLDAAKDFSTVLYLDSGTELLQSPTEIYDLIERDGYFLVSQGAALSQGHTLSQIIPSDYYRRFKLSHTHDTAPVIAAGLVGFRTDSKFYKTVMSEWLELVKGGWNLGWSQSELQRNRGLHYMEQPIIRDCQIFRHDQTLFNLLIYKHVPTAQVQSMERFGTMHHIEGVDQVMWSPKLAGKSYGYVDRHQYSRNRILKNVRNRGLVQAQRLMSRWKGARLK